MADEKNRRPKGTGCIYKRKWKNESGQWIEGDTWWIKHYRDGKPYCESTHSTKEDDPQRLLKKRQGKISEGKLPGIYFDKVRFDELTEDYLTDYKVNQRKSIDKADRSIENLTKFFGGRRVISITTAKVKEFINQKVEEGWANATINRHLSALRHIFNLAYQRTPKKVREVPYIPILEENNVRQGFFEHEEYLAVKNALPNYLKAIATFGYYTGRRKANVLGLTWDRLI